jgi:hypothetical protein
MVLYFLSELHANNVQKPRIVIKALAIISAKKTNFILKTENEKPRKKFLTQPFEWVLPYFNGLSGPNFGQIF